MKIGMRYFTSCIILILMSLSVYAQSSCHVGGIVVDERGEVVPYASAVVCQSGRIVAGALTDENGHFSVKAPRSSEECVLSVEFIGYEKVQVQFTPERVSVNLGRIVLKEAAEMLGEAMVSAKAEAVKASVEHTVINASANMASQSSQT